MTIDLNTIWQFPLRRGNSPNPSQGACLLDAVSWFEYGTLGDHPPCVCLTIAIPGRIINDFLPDDKRQELKPLIEQMVGTANDGFHQARAEFWAWKAIHVFTPKTLKYLPGSHEASAAYAASYAASSTAHAAASAAYAAAYAASSAAYAAEHVAFHAAARAAEHATRSLETIRNEAIRAMYEVCKIRKPIAIFTQQKIISANNSFTLAKQSI